jgi:predicted DNA-binding transcriptional regulator YafY
MGQTERVLRIQQLLQAGKVVSRQSFLRELEISPAQFKRDLDFLRDRFQFPIEWDRQRRGYVLAATVEEAGKYDLPGPLYTSSEIHALLLMQDLITQLQPGLLDQHLEPLRERLRLLLGTSKLPDEEISRRIRILHMASRPVDPKQFRAASEATLKRQRLKIRYRSRSNDTDSERDISPQRLVLYRANWYLDSWCHLKKDLRSFAVDSIVEAQILSEKAREIDQETLDAHLGAGYGIFAGPAEHRAVLRFAPATARWVVHEVWHSRQTQYVEPSGYLILTLPYAQEQELLMDILRYADEVEVLEPKSLRELVIQRLDRARARYS